VPVALVSHVPPYPPTHDRWCLVGPGQTRLPTATEITDLGNVLSAAFDAIQPVWEQIAAQLAEEPQAHWSHLVSRAPNVSDFGTMLAWSHIVSSWAVEPETILVICPDPWLFRHLAEIPGIHPLTPPPPLWTRKLHLGIRGFLARLWCSLRFALAAGRRPRFSPPGQTWLLSYSHPASDGLKHDAYFGNLPAQFPNLLIALHVDGGRELHRLSATPRCFPLSAWGSPWFALAGVFARWRPRLTNGGHVWLLRRAIAVEGGHAQAASIRWQIHCQSQWLRAVRPAVVSWPWENHGWERALCLAAEKADCLTLGWQHALVGRQESNYRPGLGLPRQILCSGQASLHQLREFGHDPGRMIVAGSLRYPSFPRLRHDRQAPVLVALPFNRDLAAEMISAASPLAETGLTVLVRDHPMAGPTPALPPGMIGGAPPLNQHPALSAVIFAASTIGLEAVLCGIPAIRFLPSHNVALDPLPTEAGELIPGCGKKQFAEMLESSVPPQVDVSIFFAAPKPSLWQKLFDPYKTNANSAP